MTPRPCFNLRRSLHGFTLVEVVLSIGIVSAIMIPLVMLLGHGLNHAQGITSRDRVLRLAPTVENSLNAASFDEVRDWVDSRQSFYAYVYRGNDRTDTPAEGMGSATTGNDTFYAVARSPLEVAKISTEISALEGHMYRVDLARVTNPKTPTENQRQPTKISITIEARFSQVMVPRKWQTSNAIPQMSLNYVVNR